MGPVIIFDKSVLQSLSPDEAMWLDQFFLSNITPIFFVETLADLEKEIRCGRTPESVVGNLAHKTPDFFSKLNAHHLHLLYGELTGQVNLDLEHGRPHLTGGKVVELEGKTGVVFRPSPEEEALARWQKHEFLEVERRYARDWRKSLLNTDLEQLYASSRPLLAGRKPKSLAGLKRLIDSYIDGQDQSVILNMAFTMLGVVDPVKSSVLKDWNDSGKPDIRNKYPYLAYLFSVDLFFCYAIAFDFIGHGRPSHKIDIAYLYYLPFCMIFTSNDKLHSSIVPLFLRENQTFVLGTELKEDLARIDKYYDDFPDEVKRRGVSSFASRPPKDDTFLVTRRNVLSKKGKWSRFPPEVLNKGKNRP